MPLISGYPDGQPRNFPNQFAGAISTTSTVESGSTGFLTSTAARSFGFGAALLKTVVDGGGPAYLQFNSNVVTTADYRLSTGDALTDWYDFSPFSGISIGATSTALSMRIGAWG